MTCILCTPERTPGPTGLTPGEVAFIGQTLGSVIAYLLAIFILVFIIAISLALTWSMRE